VVKNEDRNWMSSFGGGGGALGASGGPMRGGPPERPITASAENARVREVQNELKNERRDKKKMQDEIESLKNELQKLNFKAFT